MFAIPVTAYFEPHSYPRVPRTGYTFVDPATEARERLVRAVKEQQAARQAYTDILAQQELAQFSFDTPQHSYSDSVFDFTRPRGHPFRNAARDVYAAHEIQHQLNHELAIRAKREELLRQHRLKVALAHEEARRREQLQRRQELLEAQRQQQLRRAEIQRRSTVIQQQQEQEQAQAIALALAFAHEFFGAQEKETEAETAQPAKTCAGSCRRVRFARPSKAPETVTAAAQPSATRPNPASAPVASTSSAPIRITIRETKGKTSSHVRVNSTPSAAETTPADAHAALAILSSDLDGLVSPTHVWASEAHRRHSLNQLLEQVDAVESGGEESVRDVRRTLVRRVERALEGRPDEDHLPAKSKGIEIREPEPVSAPVTVKDDAATEAVVKSPNQADATPEIEGYEIPDLIEPALAAATNAAELSNIEEPAPLNDWSSEDPAAAIRPVVTLNDDVEVPSLHSDDSAQSSPVSLFSQLSSDPVTDSNVVTGAVNALAMPDNGLESKPVPSTPDQSMKKSASGDASDGEDAYELL